MAFDPSSRNRLTEYDLGRFGGTTLFDAIARAVCRAGCLPRKELYEAWEVARRARRRFRGGRILDLAAGHGLLGQILLILDDESPDARVVDATIPPSAATLHAALVDAWPRLAGRVDFIQADMRTMEADGASSDIVVSSHACGHVTDAVLDRAIAHRSRVAVLPCCHDLATSETGGLTGWIDGPLAVDVVRARRLAAEGYRVWTQTIPAAITPKNRLLLGEAG